MRFVLWSSVAVVVGCASGHGSDESGPWTAAIGEEQDTGDIDVDPHGSTTGEAQTGSGMTPPPPDESTTTTSTGVTIADESSSSAVTSSESTAADVQLDPIWSLCDANEDCESGICFFVIDPETEDPLSAYCTDVCEDAAFDCPEPDTGDAAPACLSSRQGDSLCALDCTDGEACPFGMECMPIGQASYCF